VTTAAVLITGLFLLLPPGGGQATLEAEAQSFSAAWLAKDADGLGQTFSEEGILLHLPGEKHNRLNPRQARAALGAFLRRYSEGETTVMGVTRAAGADGRGFAEIRWSTGSPGAGEPVIFTVFVAYSNAGNSWDVTEIRVLF
jgi:hypothetical protein